MSACQPVTCLVSVCQEILDDDQLPVQRVVLNESLTTWLVGVRVRYMVDGVQVRPLSIHHRFTDVDFFVFVFVLVVVDVD